MKKQFCAFFLVLALMVSLLGAAAGTPLKPDDLVKKLPDFSQYGDGDLTPYEEPVKMSIGMSINLSKPFPEGDSYENNVWSRYFKEKLNVDIELAFTTSDLADKVNTMIATGDIPDVLQVSANQLALLADSGLIRDDIYEIYDQYAGAGVRSLVEGVGGSQVIQSCTFDGKMMALPMMDTSAGEASPMLWLRTDWMEKFGLEDPKSYADLRHILEVFTTQDPDGNGEDDTVGLVFYKSLWNNWFQLDGFFNMFGSFPERGFWVTDEADPNKAAYGAFQPATKTALEELASLYSQGILDKEFAVYDQNAAKSVFASGKCGVIIGCVYVTNSYLYANKDNDPAADWHAVALPGLNSETTPVTAKLPIRNYLVFRKDFQHPEAVVKMINLFQKVCFSPDTTAETYAKYVEDNSGNSSYSAFQIYPWGWYMPAVKNERSALYIANGIKSTDPEMPSYARSFAQWVEAYEAGDTSMWRWYRFFGPDGGHLITSKYMAEDLYYMSRYYGPDTETMAESMSLIYDLADEMIIKIIMGEEPLDSFEAYKEKADALGLEQITDEVNAWLDEHR